MTGSLVFGAVSMVVQTGDEPTKVDPTADVFTVKALATEEGTTFGSAEPITEQLESFLQYGAIVVTQGWNNREGVLVVSVKGTGRQLALAEAALFAEVGKMNLLTYTPPEAGAVPMVMTVVNSWLEHQPNSGAERAGRDGVGRRRYAIHLVTSPFVFSSTLVTVAALAASGSTTTNVNNGSAVGSVTATVNGGAVTPTVVSGAIQAASATALTGTVPVVMTFPGAITTSSTKYLNIDWKVAAGTTAESFSATADGVALPIVANGPSPTAGYTRTVVFVAASSVATSVIITAQTFAPSTWLGGAVIRSLAVDNIDRTDIRPSLGSAKQQLRTLAISGSAPTIGSLAVEHSTTSLGDALIFTWPDDGRGSAPPCRSFRVSGPTPTSDATAVSGFYDLIDTATTYDVPISALPDGEYLVLVRANGITGGPVTAGLTWTYTPRLNGTNLATPVSTASLIPAAVGAGSGYLFTRLGMVHLPSQDVTPSASAVMRFTFVATAPVFADIQLDEVYLFNLTTGRLTQVACGAGTAAAGGPANRLWIDSPWINNDGLGRYTVGFAADRSDAFYPGFPSVAAEGIHEFDPRQGPVKVFTVTTNPTTAADCSFAYYPAWHTHPAA